MQLSSARDADVTGDKISRKSLSGPIFRVGDMIVGWMCRKQASVSLSTMEAEFTLAPHAVQQLLGLRELIVELEIKVELPQQLEIEIQAAIRQMQKEESLTRAKHIDIKLQFIKDCAKRGIVKPSYVHTEEMVADMLTKAFSAVRLQQLIRLSSLMRASSKYQDVFR